MAFKFNEYHLGGTGGKPAVIEPITIKENGTYNAPDGVDGYSPVTVDVGGAGGSAVLGELVVTENGVYDNPTAQVTVTADDNIIGVPLTFKKTIELSQDDLSDLLGQMNFIYDKNNFWWDIGVQKRGVGTNVDKMFYIVGYHDYDSFMDEYVYATEEMLTSSSNLDYYGITIPGWNRCNSITGKAYPCDPPVIIVENKDNFYDVDWVYTLFCVEKPADGWNKVTVDSPIVDVESFPTENVDETKIYRVTEVAEPDGEIYIVNRGASDKPMTVSKYIELAFGANVTVTYYVVESLPESLLVSNMQMGSCHVYIVPEAGKSYLTENNVDILDFMTDIVDIPSVYYNGVVSSIDEVTQDGYYFCVTDNQHIIYGIPNNATVQRFVDGAWVELT